MLPRLLASRVMASERLRPKSAIFTFPSRAACGDTTIGKGQRLVDQSQVVPTSNPSGFVGVLSRAIQ